MHTRPLCVVDLETTALDPMKGEVLMIAGIVLTPNLERVSTFQTPVIKAKRPGEITLGALAVNGVFLEDILNGIEPWKAWTLFHHWLHDAWEVVKDFCHPIETGRDLLLGRQTGFMLCAHNTVFERNWLEHYFGTYTYEPFNDHFHHQDVCTLKLAKERLKGIKHNLPALAEHFGIEHTPHDPMSDAAATVALLRKLTPGYTADWPGD